MVDDDAVDADIRQQTSNEAVMELREAITTVGIGEIGDAFLSWVIDALEEPTITLEDSFLDVGGNSMVAAHLSQQAIDRYGVELDIPLLFEGTFHDTVIRLARERHASAAHPGGTP